MEQELAPTELTERTILTGMYDNNHVVFDLSCGSCLVVLAGKQRPAERGLAVLLSSDP